jgi:hypothetical protein
MEEKKNINQITAGIFIMCHVRWFLVLKANKTKEEKKQINNWNLSIALSVM